MSPIGGLVGPHTDSQISALNPLNLQIRNPARKCNRCLKLSVGSRNGPKGGSSDVPDLL